MATRDLITTSYYIKTADNVAKETDLYFDPTFLKLFVRRKVYYRHKEKTEAQSSDG